MSTHRNTFGFVRALIIAGSIFLPGSAVAEKALTIGVQILPATRGNPHQNVSLPGIMPVQAVFDSLTRIGPDGAAGPALAIRWETTDQNTWVLHLRQDVTFSNGEPFNADAVVAAFDYLFSDAGKTETTGTHISRIHVVRAKALDATTVEITTSKPNPILPIHLDFVRIPAPKHFEDLGPTEFALAPIGTGPFQAEDWGESTIDLIKNETAWRPPAVDRITLVQVSDQAARVQGLLSGSVDVAFNVSVEDRAVVETAGGRIISYATPAVSYLQYVTAKPSPLTDLNVRRALNYAVNKQLIVDVLYEGATEPASQIAHPLAFGYNPDLVPYPYDPEQAKALLADAGYSDGFKMVSLMVGGGNDDDQVQQLIAADLARVGVTMEIQRTTFAKYLEYMYQTGWPDPYVAFYMITTGFDPMHGFRTRSCNWRTIYYCDNGITPLINSLESASGVEQHRRIISDILAYERHNPSGIFLWQPPAFDAVSERVTHYSVIADVVSFDALDVRE